MIQSFLLKSRNNVRMQIQQFYFGLHNILNNASYFNHHATDWLQLQPQPQLIMDGSCSYNGIPIVDTSSSHTLLDNLSIWFAVPKQKISHQKKRMKTTLRTRIPIRKNIITDPRTGELTLRHHLPYNWKNYLPNAVGMNNNSNNTNKSD